MPASEVKSILDKQAEAAFDLLTEDQIQKYYQSSNTNKSKIQQFEIYWESNTYNIDEKILAITPHIILENPHKDTDIYKIMGKDFGEFNFFYSYSWSGHTVNLITELITRHKPKPHIWIEENADYTNKKFLTLKEQFKRH
jgi:hypothetical protein